MKEGGSSFLEKKTDSFEFTEGTSGDKKQSKTLMSLKPLKKEGG